MAESGFAVPFAVVHGDLLEIPLLPGAGLVPSALHTASASILAHREFVSNDANDPKRIMTGQTRTAHAVLKQVPVIMPDHSASFANSPSLASRLAQYAGQPEPRQRRAAAGF